LKRRHDLFPIAGFAGVVIGAQIVSSRRLGDQIAAEDNAIADRYRLGHPFGLDDLADRRLYVLGARSGDKALDPLIGGAVDFRAIAEN
jgi:hypothetical protein